MPVWKPLRRAAIALLVAAVVVAIALIFAQDQETLLIRSALAAGDARHADYLAALIGTASVRGNSYDVLTNGDQFFPAMLEAINNAKHRINFETYIYDRGKVGDQFTGALEAACRRKVSVNIIVDAMGASTMDSSHEERLRQAGCRLFRFNPPHWYTLEELNYRTHRKILVVDGVLGFTGGAGVSDHWIGDARNKEEWRDSMVRVRGPIVQRLDAAFYENAAEVADAIVNPELFDSPAIRGEDRASMVVRSSPTGGANDLKRLYLLILASARNTLDIASPYFVTDESTRWSLEDAVKRGVKIRILVEGDITDAMPVKYASRALYDQLLSLGIEIYEYQPTMMHTKAIVADGVLSMFGSANFDNRSLELNDELNVVVTSADLAARFTVDFENDLRASKKLDRESWRARPLIQKVRERFWHAFSEIF